jgi:hypothetical protein
MARPIAFHGRTSDRVDQTTNLWLGDTFGIVEGASGGPAMPRHRPKLLIRGPSIWRPDPSRVSK